MTEPRAVLLAGGMGKRMGALAQGRSKPLIPFGGTCRLVDFSLDNARASGCSEVLLLSQHQELQLMNELHATWNTDPGFRVSFGPYDAAYRKLTPGDALDTLPERRRMPERGTADAFLTKREHVFGTGASEILVLHADHVYRMDYREMVHRHLESGAALTMAYQRIDLRYVPLFGMVAFDRAGNLTHFVEKPARPSSDLVFAAFCVFDAATLLRYLENLAGTNWQHDLSRDVIPAMLAAGERIRGYEVHGHWEDIGTLERYWQAHLAMVRPAPVLRFSDLPVTIRPDIARTVVAASHSVRDSIVPADLEHDGLVERCVVYPGVRIGRDAHVRDSVLLPGAHIPAEARIDSAVVLESGLVVHAESGGMTAEESGAIG